MLFDFYFKTWAAHFPNFNFIFLYAMYEVHHLLFWQNAVPLEMILVQNKTAWMLWKLKMQTQMINKYQKCLSVMMEVNQQRLHRHI